MKFQEHRTVGAAAAGALVEVGGACAEERVVLSYGDVVALSGDFFASHHCVAHGVEGTQAGPGHRDPSRCPDPMAQGSRRCDHQYRRAPNPSREIRDQGLESNSGTVHEQPRLAIMTDEPPSSDTARQRRTHATAPLRATSHRSTRGRSQRLPRPSHGFGETLEEVETLSLDSGSPVIAIERIIRDRTYAAWPLRVPSWRVTECNLTTGKLLCYFQ
jgi:hypothetical protein